MNYGLYLAASGLMVNQFRQDVVSNNIANLETPGFRPDMVMIKQRPAESGEGPATPSNPQKMLEGLGGGVLADRVRTRFGQGQLVRSGSPLDVGIKGEGFLVLSKGSGTGDERLRFTRDGRLAVGPNGTLIHASSGMEVIGEGNRSIELERGIDPEISGSGEITQNGQVVGQLQLVTSENPEVFKKAGLNTFLLEGSGARSVVSAGGAVQQGWYEASGVDPMGALLELKSTSGAIANATRMIRYHDGLMNAAINRLGRVG